MYFFQNSGWARAHPGHKLDPPLIMDKIHVVVNIARTRSSVLNIVGTLDKQKR